jgi:hypothetical protein
MDFNVLPDEKLEELLMKYVEKSERYKFFVNEETDRTEQKVLDIHNELKRREEFRNSMQSKKLKINDSKFQN